MVVEGDESSQLRMANSSLSRLPALIDSPDHVCHFFFYCFSIILGKGKPTWFPFWRLFPVVSGL